MTRPDFNKAKDEALANDPALKVEYETKRQELNTQIQKGLTSGDGGLLDIEQIKKESKELLLRQKLATGMVNLKASNVIDGEAAMQEMQTMIENA